MRLLKFDLNVNANALLCPNPQEFYSKAYITEDIANNFRALPGIKTETKIANVLFNDVLKSSACNFSADTQQLNATDINVCSLSAMAELCRFDLEQSFISLQMAKGANSSFEVPSFMSYYWDEMSKEIQAEIAQLRWKGNTAGATGTYLDLCDGYEVKLAADINVIPVGGTTVDSSNVIAELTKVYQALPASIQSKTNDLRFYVSANVAAAFKVAAALGNSLAYITKELDLTFLGIKLVIQEGMSANKMVATLKDNMIYAFDGEGDSKELKAVNLEDTVAEPLLRTRANMKVGFHYVNPTEIVFYN